MCRFTVASPSGQVQLHLVLKEGQLFWCAEKNGVSVLDLSPVGITLAGGSFTQGFTVMEESRSTIDETYQIPAFKKSLCKNHANILALLLQNGDGQITVEARAYDDGAALRILADGEGPCAILGESTGFAIPAAAREIYGMKYVFSYEDHYHPIPRSELPQNNLAFPVLVDISGGLYALYAEAAVFGDYGSSTLCSEKDSPLLLRLRQAPDQLGATDGVLPLATPWRVVLCGDLNDIATSNTLENLNPPSIVEDPSFIRPGTSAWSWMTENDSTKDPKRCKEYVDYAAAMGFDYYLADGGWPGTVDIPDLVKYAAERGVKIWIWEHSAAIRSPEIAEEKLALWASWGVVGVKIDFFESDGAHRVKQYDYLAEIAARHRLMLNFHGCMKPAGESRTWPHVMTREAVMGGEYLQNFSTFLPGGPDAAHNCTLPFTRNAMGPMDYTPVCYNTYLTGTTDAHQTALPVIFTSYILHIGEGAETVLNHPARPFLSKVPAAWDESRVLEAHPAAYVTMARKKADSWYVAGICARRPRNATVPFNFLDDGAEYTATLYADDLSDLRPFDAAEGALPPPDKAMVDALERMSQRPAHHQHDMHAMKITTFKVKKGDSMQIPLSVNGGFAMVLEK